MLEVLVYQVLSLVMDLEMVRELEQGPELVQDLAEEASKFRQSAFIGLPFSFARSRQFAYCGDRCTH